MTPVEVFADVSCPFTHVGLHRLQQHRDEQCRTELIFRVRAWPLELVNGHALDGASLTPKIAALREQVTPDLFARFDPHRFPPTTLPALAAEAAAYRRSLEVGQRFSLAVRRALFEDGLDVSDPAVLRTLRETYGVPDPVDADRAAVLADFTEGQRRGVAGSPHFFTSHRDFFCPSLDIEHDDDGYRVSFDVEGFERFVASVDADLAA